MSSPFDPPLWQIIVPVRGGPVGKSRLTDIEGRRLSGSERNALAMAMAHDTVTAAVTSGRGSVMVLTDDDLVGAMAHECGATTASDEGRGLNDELTHAATSLAPHVAVCVLLGDLPALRPEDLREVLDLAETAPGTGVFVPDWEGAGTTLVASARGAGDAVPFRFGPGSAERHQRAGLLMTGVHLARLRTDVDTPGAWAAAVRLGLGPSTAALRERLLASAGEGDAAPLG